MESLLFEIFIASFITKKPPEIFEISGRCLKTTTNNNTYALFYIMSFFAVQGSSATQEGTEYHRQRFIVGTYASSSAFHLMFMCVRGCALMVVERENTDGGLQLASPEINPDGSSTKNC